jgi:hypothetical protein
MTHFIVRTCTHPGAPIVLAGAAQVVAPTLAALRELARASQASFRSGTPDGVFGSRQASGAESVLTLAP